MVDVRKFEEIESAAFRGASMEGFSTTELKAVEILSLILLDMTDGKMAKSDASSWKQLLRATYESLCQTELVMASVMDAAMTCALDIKYANPDKGFATLAVTMGEIYKGRPVEPWEQKILDGMYERLDNIFERRELI